MKKQISLLSIIVWIVTCSFEHAKQIGAALGMAAPVVATAQFSPSVGADTSATYNGQFSGKKIYIVKDSIGPTNMDFFWFNSNKMTFARHTAVRNDGTPTSVAWFNANGDLMRSPFPASTASTSIVSTNTIITVSGTAPNYSITAKRQEKYSGTTVAAGTYSVNFATPYPITPDIQASWIGAADNQNLRITAVSTTGFTVLARNRVDVIGLLPTWNNVSGASINVIITER